MESRTFNIGKTEVLFYDHYPYYFFVEDDGTKLVVRLETPDDMIDIGVRCGFDYERYRNKEWSIHIDIDFSIFGYCDAYVRSSFHFKRDLEKLFIPETIEPLMQEALNETAKTIMKKCREHNFPFEDDIIPFNEELVRNFSNEAIATFNSKRLEEERAAGETRLNQGITIPADGVAQMVLSGTIVIIDKVMFEDKVFDWKNNSEAFSAAVPTASYITMRHQCLSLEDKPILLNWNFATYLIICIDCALQLLLGTHSERLENSLAGQGFAKETTEQYILHTSKVLANLKSGFKKDNINIENLKKVYDWNSVLR